MGELLLWHICSWILTIFFFRSVKNDMNNEENMLPILYATFEVAIALIFCIGSILNTIMVIVFFRRRGFRSHLSNRFVLCILTTFIIILFFGQCMQKIYFEERRLRVQYILYNTLGMLSIITQKKFFYVERFPVTRRKHSK